MSLTSLAALTGLRQGTGESREPDPRITAYLRTDVGGAVVLVLRTALAGEDTPVGHRTYRLRDGRLRPLCGVSYRLGAGHGMFSVHARHARWFARPCERCWD